MDQKAAEDLVDINGAQWLDLSGNQWDIDSADALKDAYNKTTVSKSTIPEGTHRDISLTLLFNDNEESDGFRSVYLVVVNSVDDNKGIGFKNGHIGGTNTPTEGNVSITIPADTTAEDVYGGNVDTDKNYAAGKSFTVERKPGYKFGTISGATLGDDGKTFTVNNGASAVSIQILVDDSVVTVSDYIASGAEVSGNVAFGAKVYTGSDVSAMVDKATNTVKPIFSIDQAATVWKDAGNNKEYTGWVPADAKATVYYEVYGVIDGKEEPLGSNSTSAGASLAVDSTGITNPLVSMTNTFKIKVTNVEWDKVNVVYEFANVPASITETVSVTDTSTKSLASGATAAAANVIITFNVKVSEAVSANEGKVTDGALSYTFSNVEGLTGTAGSVAPGGTVAADSTVTTNASGNTVPATRPVVVKVDASGLTTTAASFTITGIVDEVITGTGVAANTELTVTPSKTTAGRETIDLTATLDTAIPVTSDPVKVTVDGKYEFIFVNDGTTLTATKTVPVNVTGDIDLSEAEIVVTPLTGVTPVATVAHVNTAAASLAATDKIIVRFDGIELDTDDIGNANFTPAQGTSSTSTVFAVNGDAKVVYDSASNSSTITLTCQTSVITENNTLTIAAGAVKTAEGYCNKTAIVIDLDNITGINAIGNHQQSVRK